ncbi:hypothetical protein [Nocardia sp. NPDC020380]|uniref:hypothetical protein n=1 Tax=Nocardia sp. NPDC020380 TaxID=3364309 RepID=UPI0037B0B307
MDFLKGSSVVLGLVVVFLVGGVDGPIVIDAELPAVLERLCRRLQIAHGGLQAEDRAAGVGELGVGGGDRPDLLSFAVGAVEGRTLGGAGPFQVVDGPVHGVGHGVHGCHDLVGVGGGVGEGLEVPAEYLGLARGGHVSAGRVEIAELA